MALRCLTLIQRTIPAKTAILATILLIEGSVLASSALEISVEPLEGVSFSAWELAGGPGTDFDPDQCEPEPDEAQVSISVTGADGMSWEIDVQRTHGTWPAGDTLQIRHQEVPEVQWTTISAGNMSKIFEGKGNEIGMPFQLRVSPSATSGAGRFDTIVTYTVVETVQ